ncbi:KH homology domain-containing protein 4-like [Corticium candelabrum]|uniref:KH homology domain-containing protein 4-like n=1 Tax=Corticium candelabrum TaxID=121492 RepID=UPI002E26FC95|nr:KH homology domain-containing protein 4-like [Corticium candelabrum]
MKRRSKWDQLLSDMQFQGREIVERPPEGMFAPVGTKFDVNSLEATQSGSNAAAAMAAKLNAMLAAQGKIMKAPAPLPIGNAMQQQQMVPQFFTVEVVINDIPSRVILTRSATHQEILRQTGAAVSVKGRHMTPEEKSLGTMDRPLYLYICADTQAKVNAAKEKVKTIILQSELSFPVDQRPFTNNPHLFNTIGFDNSQMQRPGEAVASTPVLRYVQDKVFVEAESVPGFDVIEKISGPQGSYLRHIAAETGAKVFFRGQGSGYIEPTSGKESFEPFHLYISHPRNEGLHAAKRLCENLVQKVQRDYEMFVHSQHQLHQHQYQHQHPPMDDITGGNWGSNYKSGPPSLMSLQLPYPQMHHFPPARHHPPMGPQGPQVFDHSHLHPPHQPLMMEPRFGFEAEPRPPYNPGSGPGLPMQFGPPPLPQGPAPQAVVDPFIPPCNPPRSVPPTTFDYPPPQPEYPTFNTQPAPQPVSQPVHQSTPLGGFNVISWNPAAVPQDEPKKDETEGPAPPPAKRRFTEAVTSESSDAKSVKTSSQSSHSSVGDNVEFQVPSNVTSPRRFQESQHSSTSSGQTFAKPLPPRSSGTFAKPAPPPPVAWPDKSKEEDNNAKNKSKQVSGLASLMAYEGDSDDDST